MCACARLRARACACARSHAYVRGCARGATTYMCDDNSSNFHQRVVNEDPYRTTSTRTQNTATAHASRRVWSRPEKPEPSLDQGSPRDAHNPNPASIKPPRGTHPPRITRAHRPSAVRREIHFAAPRFMKYSVEDHPLPPWHSRAQTPYPNPTPNRSVAGPPSFRCLAAGTGINQEDLNTVYTSPHSAA